MKTSTLWLGFGLCGITIGAIVWAQNTRPILIANATAFGASQAPKAPVAAPVNASASRPLHYYDSAHISENMFTRPLPPAPKPPPPPLVEQKPPPPPPPTPDPFANYVYSGTVTLGDQRIAIVEDTRTKDGKFLKVGDNFLSGTVTQIEPGQVMLRVGASVRSLPKSTTVNLTPLTRSAAFLGGGQNGPGVPGAPGGPPMPGGPGMPVTMMDTGMMQVQAMQAQAEAVQAAISQKMMGGDMQVMEFKMNK